MAKVLSVCAAAGIAALGRVSAAETPAATVPVWEQRPDLAGIVALVPPLKSPLPRDWQPTLFWWQVPLSYGDPAKLKSEVQVLWERGLLPCVELEAEFDVPVATVDKRVAEAKAVAAAGFPVHLAMKGRLDLYLRPDGKRVRHPEAPEADRKDAVGETMPCLVLREGWDLRAAHIRGLMQRFAAAQVPVAGVWYDYEGHPHPWNGVWEMNAQCAACRKEYPEGVLANRDRFVAWCFDRHSEALATAFAKPVRDAFAEARTGFYSYTVSSEAQPYVDWIGLCYPPSRSNPPEIDVVQPVCYAHLACARGRFNADWPVTREEMDPVYFACLLRAVSRLHANIRANQAIVPFVTSFCGDAGFERIPRMSKGMYREFLRHALLRGARGFYCFNVAPPYGVMADFYGELADINAVYNEMLAYREFLEGGVVLNDDWPDPKDCAGVVWSGLRKGDRALVRVVTHAPVSRWVDVAPFPGQAVRLLASPAGATCLVEASGRVQVFE